MTPNGSNFSDGVKYSYITSFSKIGTVNYKFEALSYDGIKVNPYPENATLSLQVYKNPAGWDLRVTDLSATPGYMSTP